MNESEVKTVPGKRTFSCPFLCTVFLSSSLPNRIHCIHCSCGGFVFIFLPVFSPLRLLLLASICLNCLLVSLKLPAPIAVSPRKTKQKHKTSYTLRLLSPAVRMGPVFTIPKTGKSVHVRTGAALDYRRFRSLLVFAWVFGLGSCVWL